MSEYDMNGNVVAESVTNPSHNDTALVQLPDIAPAPVFRYGHGRNARPDANPNRWTWAKIYSIPGFERYHIVSKFADNPKHSGQALMLWPMYGTPERPAHTVGSWLALSEAGTLRDQNGQLMLPSKLRDDMLYNLNKGWQRLASPSEFATVNPATSRNSYGTKQQGGNAG